MPRRALAALVILLLLFAVPGRADTPPVTPAPGDAAPEGTAPAPGQPVVTWKDGLLSVEAADAPLPIVLRAVANATGATLRGEMPQRSVTVSFTALPPAAAMPRLLGTQSFMLRYGGGGSLRTIELLGTSVAAPAPAPAVPAQIVVPPAPPPGAALAAAEQDAAKLEQPITVNGALANALGAREQSIGRVLHAAVGEQDPEVRQAARASILQAFKQHPEAEMAYFASLEPVSDDVLAATLAAQGPGTQELLTELVVHVQSPRLRVKLTNVLGALRAREVAAGQ